MILILPALTASASAIATCSFVPCCGVSAGPAWMVFGLFRTDGPCSGNTIPAGRMKRVVAIFVHPHHQPMGAPLVPNSMAAETRRYTDPAPSPQTASPYPSPTAPSLSPYSPHRSTPGTRSPGSALHPSPLGAVRVHRIAQRHAGPAPTATPASPSAAATRHAAATGVRRRRLRAIRYPEDCRARRIRHRPHLFIGMPASLVVAAACQQHNAPPRLLP